AAGGAARMDLLTVVLHELGLALGFTEDDPAEPWVMARTLTAGVQTPPQLLPVSGSTGAAGTVTSAPTSSTGGTVVTVTSDTQSSTGSTSAQTGYTSATQNLPGTP